MKKIMMALCAFAAICMVACNPDDPSPDNPGNNDEPTVGEGIYNPGAHIVSVESNEGYTEEWVWDGLKLNTITTTYEEGNTTTTTIEYRGNRMQKITETDGDNTTESRITYNGNYISELSVYTNGTMSMTATVSHDAAHRINHMDVTIDESYLTALMQMMIGDVGLFDRSPLARLVGPNAASRIVTMASISRHRARKATINSAAVSVDLVWEGNNVGSMIINANINMGVTIDEISHSVDLEDVLGDLAQYAQYFTGEYPLEVVMSDTADYTYDAAHNPLQGFMVFSFEPTALSTNNVLTATHHGQTDVTLTISVVGSEFPISRNMPIDDQEIFTIDYNDNNYPLTVTSSDGSSTTYTYSE